MIYDSDRILSVDFRSAVSKYEKVDNSSIYPSWDYKDKEAKWKLSNLFYPNPFAIYG